MQTQINKIFGLRYLIGYYVFMLNPLKSKQMPSNQPQIKKNQTNSTPLPQNEFRDVETAVATALLRDVYKREQHVFQNRVILILVALVAFMGVMLVVIAMRPVPTKILVEDQDGHIVPVIPTNQPITSLSVVENWMANAVVAANTYDFSNYRRQLGRAERYFTVAGWNGWLTALKQSSNFQSVLSDKMVVSAIPTSAPVLLSRGIMDGRYTWVFQLPMSITYQVLNQKTPQNITYIVKVVRVPETNHPSGMAIESINGMTQR
jgi:intracellular multiplication protein IcmL